MEESTGSRYASHFALQTLKERCQSLQQRLSLLEEENIALRIQCSKSEPQHSVTESDILKLKILELTEQKTKLEDNFHLVANENKKLWTRLLKLLQVNKTLGARLTKINESLNQHTKKGLIRSNTFAQSDCDAKRAVAENDKISLELEDVSLKLISTMAKEKTELEAQCSEMMEIQNTVASNSFGFSYVNDNNDTLVQDLEQHLTDLKSVKDTLEQQNIKLATTLVHMDHIKSENICPKCSKSLNAIIHQNVPPTERDNEEELQLESLARWGTPEHSTAFVQDERSTHICPMCNKTFSKNSTANFLLHVENHFKI
ncbi:autophagy receptor zinc finger-c2h2 domain [Holotrichia oblita]|uniref:Autophagy receptor zinc finger-c2h2 domain n=2 Tax=Holotrichia oblita TaxID=644536 RepID=A0ACB9SYA8_HOLOL|nr:autophagy receptor zinc finger-c2h2 domain [Holotrichia oblita]KAI4459746.1 autophagy receptor zinc finger-c2h2 domain [Holotrichia oblita]